MKETSSEIQPVSNKELSSATDAYSSEVRICSDCGASEVEAAFYKWVDKQGRNRTDCRCLLCKKKRRNSSSSQHKEIEPFDVPQVSFKLSADSEDQLSDEMSVVDMATLVNVFIRLRGWKNQKDRSPS